MRVLETGGLLVASPECQGFTPSGRTGRTNPVSPAKLRREGRRLRARNTSYAVLAACDVARPEKVVVENVVEFLEWQLYPAWRGMLEAMGYHVREHCIMASNYGSATDRERAILTASMHGPIDLAPTWGTEQRTIGDCLLDDDDERCEWVPIGSKRRMSEAGRMCDRMTRTQERFGSRVVWGNVDKSLKAFIKAGNAALGLDVPENAPVSELPHQMKEWIAGHTLLGRADAITRRDLLFFPVVEPGTGKINRAAVLAVLGGRAAQAAASEETKLSAREMASSLLEEAFQVAGTTDAKQQTKHSTCGKRFGAFIREGIKGADLTATSSSNV